MSTMMRAFAASRMMRRAVSCGSIPPPPVGKSKTLYAGGKVLGTPGFMAPEQALGKQVDHRADVCALGSTLYAALTGAPPFEGETPIEILLRKLMEPPRPLAAKARPGSTRCRSTFSPQRGSTCTRSRVRAGLVSRSSIG